MQLRLIVHRAVAPTEGKIHLFFFPVEGGANILPIHEIPKVLPLSTDQHHSNIK